MEQVEIWKGIEGLEDRYEVSNTGRFRSIDAIIKCRNGINQRVKGVEFKIVPSKAGYCSVNINTLRKFKSLHRLVAKTFIPNPNNYPEVNHIDGNKSNNNASNLEWCDRKHNVDHAVRTGLTKCQQGERHYCSKLTESDVIEIREKRKSGIDLKVISIEYGVDPSTVYQIAKKKIWKHVI